MARKELSEQAQSLKQRILEDLLPDLQWTNDSVRIHFSFKEKGDDEFFHIDVIEDYQSHMHIRGWFNDDLLEVTSIHSNVTHDLFYEVLSFLNSNY